MLENATYELLEERMEPGDRLLLFSDGISEAENADGEFFDKAAMTPVIAEHLSSTCDDLLAALEQAVMDFIESPLPADDVTIVIVEYAG
jgi:serine phosphatase RsbU (regulator of sigma subunit)